MHSAIAWRLARRGMRVKVVDAGRIGGESSWAGAGMLAPGGEIDNNESPWARWSVELTAESGIVIDFDGGYGRIG